MSRLGLVIFAGGRATRLGGTNKALLEIGGLTILQRILAALGPLVDERLVLTNDRSLDSTPGLRLVFDSEPHAGVLPALANGLAAAESELCLVVACDMPFVSRTAFERLLELQREADADVVIPRTHDFLEPMHAVYRRQPVLAAIQAALERGEKRMISYFGDVRVREATDDELRQVDPELLTFLNVNTQEELERARALAGQDHSRPDSRLFPRKTDGD